jgi:RimJ/RimL family protein N-acetyltransferase
MSTIETRRLLLRPFELADEETFVAHITDPDFMQFSRSGALEDSAARAAFIRRLALANSQFNKFALIEKATNLIIGYCGVDTCELEGKQELELGYRLIANARGRGYATEAARAVLDYYERQGVTHIIAFTVHGNNPSQAVLKKLGYKMIKTGEFESMPIVIFHRQ